MRGVGRLAACFALASCGGAPAERHHADWAIAMCGVTTPWEFRESRFGFDGPGMAIWLRGLTEAEFVQTADCLRAKLRWQGVMADLANEDEAAAPLPPLQELNGASPSVESRP